MLPLNIKETQAYNNYWEHVLLDRDHHIRGNWLFVLFCSITLFVITQYLRNIANRNQRRYFNLEQVWKQICQYSDNALSLFPGILKHFCSDNHRKPRIFAFKVAIFFMEFAVGRQVGRQEVTLANFKFIVFVCSQRPKDLGRNYLSCSCSGYFVNLLLGCTYWVHF